jgi:hypothetical protein
MTSTTLNLSGAPVSPNPTFTSTINFTAGASELQFADSSSLTWATGGILNLSNWDPLLDKVRFGTNSSGLTRTQLGQIQFNGGELGAHLDSNGYLVAGALPGVQGDYNNNGGVDAADYVLWRNGGPLQNEVNTVGTVDATDYDAWKERFGNISGSGSSVAGNSVPEPSTGTLWLFGLATRPRRRRR